MASSFSAIRARMLIHAALPSGVTMAVGGPYPLPINAEDMPCVELIWGDAEYLDVDVGAQKQRTRLLTIIVYAKDKEGVDEAIEQLQCLWDTQPARSEVNALGVIQVVSSLDAPSFDVDDTNSVHNGTLQLDVTYRTTIA